jgi:hypothetical protein
MLTILRIIMVIVCVIAIILCVERNLIMQLIINSVALGLNIGIILYRLRNREQE